MAATLTERETATLVTYKKDGNIAVLELNDPPANTYTHEMMRQLDDAILHLRFDEPEIGTWVLRTEGDRDRVTATEALLDERHWLAREIRLLWGRTLKRLDVSSRTLVALIEPGSCFAGTLAELALAADRSLMLDGGWGRSGRRFPDAGPTAALARVGGRA